ncbi:hypothetical protein F4810DRAFT_604470 [Camillea tinctor]|nr:hypothetical protein F4810DRAFT_604470 [Camillea tinctor]
METLVRERGYNIGLEILGSHEISRRASLCSSSHHCSTPASPHTSRKVSFDIGPKGEIPNPCESERLYRGPRSSSVPIPVAPLGNKIKRAVASIPIPYVPKLISKSCTDEGLTPLRLYRDSAVLSGNARQDANERLLRQLRRYSFMSHLDRPHKNMDGPVPLTQPRTEPPPALDRQPELRSKGLLQDILRRPSESSVKISRLNSSAERPQTIPESSNGRARISCSEDHTPHICVDEQLTPSTEGGLDWLS